MEPGGQPAFRVTGSRPAAAPAAGLDLLFVVPPGGQTAHFPEHLGVAFLRAVLAREGVRAEQLLPPRNLSAPGLAAVLEARRPPVVGLTVYESNLRACRAVSAVVRRCLPETVVLVGGPSATFSPAETLELVDGDVALRGAGEARIAPLVRTILGARQARRRLPELLAGAPGLVLATPAGPHHTPGCDLSSFPAGPFACLDELPSPYQLGLVATPEVGLLTARGCNQRCTYCSFAEISGRRVHYHGVERVLEDLAVLQALVRRGAPGALVPVNDDAFTLAPERARAICEGIVGRGLQLPLVGQTRADRVDAELLRLMRAAGFRVVNFGLESAVPRVLRAIGKLQDPATTEDPGFELERAFLERVRGAVAAAREAGLQASVSVIGGLPTETADDFRATLAFVESLRVPTYSHNVLTLLPGTPAYRDRARLGLAAGRHRPSGAWATRHAFDVRAVPPLRNSSGRAALREEAEALTDALCGRPRPGRACDGAAWAVVLHHDRPDPAALAWLPEVAAWHAAVVVVSEAGSAAWSDVPAWHQALLRAEVPWGSFALLQRQDRGEGALELRSAGTLGAHRFRIERRFGAAAPTIVEDERGDHLVSIWLATGGEAPPSAEGVGPLTPTPQLADSCRWWSGGRRCRSPAVLHLWPGGDVTPCWRGPAIGRVGDPSGALLARAQALGPAAGDRCPLAGAGEVGGEGPTGMERQEVAAQLAWLWRGAEDGSRAGPTEEERT